ncbi:MAG: hypothetical protein J5938_06615 [Clostridia bacterium]|nr:hypothetical protein [Clostridia bacterium]
MFETASLVIENGAVLHGRKVDVFRQKSGTECGYRADQWDAFAVIHPEGEQPGRSYPLVVSFHSGGDSLFQNLADIQRAGPYEIYYPHLGAFMLSLDCREHEQTDWWWGGINAKGEGDRSRSGTGLQPVEHRILRALDWVTERFPIDCSRIYAVGNSMGGSGALGLALRRGDLFAAIKANVPAGVRHAADRCCLDTPAPEGFSVPDPPLVIDYSAQNDSWSAGHEVLYRGMRERKYQLFGFWGPFGHAYRDDQIRPVNDLIQSVDLFSFSRDEAYPVFTNASTDDRIPWPDETDRTDAGQVNGFFRWNVLEDSETRFSVALRLLSPEEWETRVSLPSESVADLTLRRFQKFRLSAGQSFRYRYGDKTGTGTASEDGRPEWTRIAVRRAPTVLTIEPAACGDR